VSPTPSHAFGLPMRRLAPPASTSSEASMVTIIGRAHEGDRFPRPPADAGLARRIDEGLHRGGRGLLPVEGRAADDRCAGRRLRGHRCDGGAAGVGGGAGGAGAGQRGGPGIGPGYARPSRLDAVAAAFPSLNVIAAHFGYPWHLELLAMALHKTRIYIDTSVWAPKYIPAEVIREMKGR